MQCSCNKDASSTSSLDSLLSSLGEKLSLDDDWDLRHLTFSEDLEETRFGNINHRCLALEFLGSGSCFFRDEGPQLVCVHRWTEFVVSLHVECSNSILAEPAGVVFVHHDSLVMHASCKTSTTWTLSVLSNTSVSHGAAGSVFSGLLQS